MNTNDYTGNCSFPLDCIVVNKNCEYIGPCVCKHHFELSGSSSDCLPCPGLSGKCRGCCLVEALRCINDICECISNEYFNMCQSQNGVFITASQIALSAALVMGIAALGMVIYRLCTKPRFLTARQRNNAHRTCDSVNVERHNFLRESLTSIQIRVLSRLRDRPPAYDNQAPVRSISQRVDDNSRISEAPPPYEGQRDVHLHLPPPYTEVIVNTNELNGFYNPSYVGNETQIAMARLAENPGTKIANQQSTETIPK